MKSLKQLLFSVLVLSNAPSFSQQVTFNKVVSPLGGFSGFVGGIAQDKNGYMWIATYGGLFRYDGYRFKTYVRDPDDSYSISATRLETVCADSKGMIWIATWVQGLDRLDPSTGRSRPLEAPDRRADRARRPGPAGAVRRLRAQPVGIGRDLRRADRAGVWP